jgi:serine/threonine-protein kinase
MKIDPKEWPELSPLMDRMFDEPPEARSDWIAGLTGDDALHAPRLRELLKAANDQEAANRLGTLPKLESFLSPSAESEPEITATSEIGPYRLIRLLGRGGMGTVWYAERSDGLMRRGIALKLPMGYTGDDMLAARFARERDIVASLVHPNIARLYDAGVSANGQPYLALEYVEGRPIDAFCDAHELSVQARIELFYQVLHAVQYAHSRLIVHRDLKPSNILVTKDREVRLLDFGIAKLLHGTSTEATEITRIGGISMTLSYASPEQVAGLAASTATDIYSLGVILFELLVGARPYRVTRDTVGALEEAVIRSDIALPSSYPTSQAVAKLRSTTPQKLRRQLRGDMDAILLKMLERRPEQRYATVAAALDDLQRHCEGKTVLAHPPSRWYWLRKFVARNQLVVASVGLASIALLVTATIALWQAGEARRQARVAHEERDRALSAAEHREAVEDFMSDLLLEAGRNGRPISIAELISRADRLSAIEFAGNSEARAAVLANIGVFKWQFEGIDKALDYFDQSQQVLGKSGDIDLRAHISCNRAVLRGILGHSAEAQQIFSAFTSDPAIPASAKSECFGEQAKLAIVRYDGVTATKASELALRYWNESTRRSPYKRLELMAYVAEAQILNGKLGEAERGFSYILGELKRQGRERSEIAAMVRVDQRDAATESGDLYRALEIEDEAIADSLADVPDQRPVLWLNERSVTLADLGRFADALKGFEEVAGLAASGDRTSERRAQLSSAAMLSKLGRVRDAEQQYQQAIHVEGASKSDSVPSEDIAVKLTRAKLDLDQRNFRQARQELAVIRQSAADRMRSNADLGDGDIAAAIEDGQASVEISRQLRGDKPFSAWVGEAQLALGQALEKNRNLAGARMNLSAAVEQLTHAVGPDHPDLKRAREQLRDLDNR